MSTARPTSKTRSHASRIAARPSAVGHRAARDMAARRRREELSLLDMVRQEADDAARARPALLSLLSHDLRNPLSVVLVSLRMLARALPAEHAARKHVDAIGRAADEMSGILQDMSDAARIEEGRLTLTLTREEVGAMLARAADHASRAAHAKNVSIVVDAAPATWVLCDRDRVQKLLSGLVANAVRITPRGHAVEARAAQDEGAVRIAVTDGGQGVPRDLDDRAFDLPASNGPSGQARVAGVGLSLYAARGIVEAHGGAIDLERAASGGSTFVITLPEGELEGLA
jgi:signal transduction histidine kinase